MDGLLDLYLRVLLWLALVGCFAVLVVPALPRLKGRIGEWLVHQRLKHALPASHYTLFRDLALRHATDAGVDTAQIDHVVVSPYGVFVIETRHYSGWIFGAEREPEWTRVHFRSRRKFPNPLRENHAHIRALQELLGLDDGVFHSLVVFSGSAEIRTPMPPNVTRLGGMLPYIQVRTAELLGFEEAARAAGVLTAKRLAPGVQSTAAHIASLRNRQGARFGARQALLGLVLMVSLVAVAGTLIEHLSEVPHRYPGENPGQYSGQNSGQYEEQYAVQPFGHDEPAVDCAWSPDAQRCTCYELRDGQVHVAREACEALAAEAGER
jgi:hypothetical protein